MTTLVTIPFACGHRRSIGVRDIVGFLYLGPGFKYLRRRRVDCKEVAKDTS